ncbi:MAG TPA: 6-phosphogluconolactonase [Armatimonadota bacterium]|nr:6-phosphogluconolactonase [Armatimonadota bacterium]HOM80551.1 6-phosphogluconolactonase [Armatimonadota bacterium]HPO71404.1 6-phosphogluconolactonase [Armatimonadota bacterium]
MEPRDVRLYPDAEAVAEAAADYLIALAGDALAHRDRFCLALSGGSTPRMLYARLARPEEAGRVDWSRVHLFWGDERCVPPDHPESNYRMAWDVWLRHAAIPAENIHRVQGELPPPDAAADYERELRAFFVPESLPRFDLVLLGMGEDGHTASLFPESPALHEHHQWVMAVETRQSVPWRVTLTPPAINAAAHVLFLVTGAAKAERLQEVLHGPHEPERLPAQIIQPTSGSLTWMVDAAAGSLLYFTSDTLP